MHLAQSTLYRETPENQTFTFDSHQYVKVNFSHIFVFGYLQFYRSIGQILHSNNSAVKYAKSVERITDLMNTQGMLEYFFLLWSAGL